MRLRSCCLAALLCVCGLVLCARPAVAQPTNMAAFQELALGCLAGAPGDVQAFTLAAPSQMPYLRSALVARWQADGRTVYLQDAPPPAPAEALARPTLTYAIEEVGLTYTRASRKTAGRAVVLGLRYTLAAADGQVLRDDRCRDTFSDTVPRAQLPLLEAAGFSETQAPAPPPGWVRRYLEPAVLSAATLTGIYLFFTLRSDRAEAN